MGFLTKKICDVMFIDVLNMVKMLFHMKCSFLHSISYVVIKCIFKTSFTNDGFKQLERFKSQPPPVFSTNSCS